MQVVRSWRVLVAALFSLAIILGGDVTAFAAASASSATQGADAREWEVAIEVPEQADGFEESLLLPRDQPVVVVGKGPRTVSELQQSDGVVLENQRVGRVRLHRPAREPIEPAANVSTLDGPRRVVGTSSWIAHEVIAIRTDRETIEVTPEHLIADVNAGWKPARAFVAGDAIEASAGPVVVRHVERRATGPRPVLNLLVEDTHAFRVGQDGILVHNGGCVVRPVAAGMAPSRGADVPVFPRPLAGPPVAPAPRADQLSAGSSGFMGGGTASFAPLGESTAVLERPGRGVLDGTVYAGMRPSDAAAQNPTRKQVNDAMEFYRRDRHNSHGDWQISVPAFFGAKEIKSANSRDLDIVRLKPDPNYKGEPIAFLRAYYDRPAREPNHEWNGRYKDMYVARVLDSSGPGLRNVAPQATQIADEGSALVRIWPKYTPFSKGPPPGMTEDAMRAEVARALFASHVAGNMDGPLTNKNNGGMSLIDGKWRGVIIDCGACWHGPDNRHHPYQPPWADKGAVFGRPVKKDDVPKDVWDSLKSIASAPPDQLLKRTGMGKGDHSLSIVAGKQQRARDILNHYGVRYN